MNTPLNQHDATPTKRQVLAEVLLVFAVFFVQGADPVPTVNEPYYLGKAIHYWNPDWGQGDFFLEESTDATHLVFYFTFGWLACWLPPTVLAWTGRVLTWALLAWAWRRLSFAVVPRQWCAILTAAVFVALLDWCHFAGEWVIGGVEAKGFAYVFVLLGLEALVRDRWNRAWLLFGVASALHVLVGGWSAVAAGIAWVLLGKERPPMRSMWPAVLGGFLLSLPGLVPALLLNRGTDLDTVGRAQVIYVYERLAHHLAPWVLPEYFWTRIAWFGAVAIVWFVLSWTPATDQAMRRLRAFVAGAIAIAAVGATIGPLQLYNEAVAAELLRFYWFRLSDVAVPLGVSLALVSMSPFAPRKNAKSPFAPRKNALPPSKTRPAMAWCLLLTAIAAAGTHLGLLAFRPISRPPVAHRSIDPAYQLDDFLDWQDICRQVAESDTIPRNARFLTPMASQTFKWYSGRGEVANWKEIPQDAETIVVWWNRLGKIHGSRNFPLPASVARWRWWEQQWRAPPWQAAPATLPDERDTARVARWLIAVGKEYEAGYVLTVAQPALPLPVVCRNDSYVVYSLE